MTDKPNGLSEEEEWLYTKFQELKDSVIEMRVHQKAYFKSRSQESLIKAKVSEAKVDKILHFE